MTNHTITKEQIEKITKLLFRNNNFAVIKILKELPEELDILNLINKINLVTTSNVKDHDDLIRIETQEHIKLFLKTEINKLKSPKEIKE